MLLRLAWNLNLRAPVLTSAQGPETARQPAPLWRGTPPLCGCTPPACLPPIIPPFKLQIKASSHMKRFWGLKLNFSTTATAAVTVPNSAWWINIHVSTLRSRTGTSILHQLIAPIIIYFSKLIGFRGCEIKFKQVYFILINNGSGLWRVMIIVYFFLFLVWQVVSQTERQKAGDRKISGTDRFF